MISVSVTCRPIAGRGVGEIMSNYNRCESCKRSMPFHEAGVTWCKARKCYVCVTGIQAKDTNECEDFKAKEGVEPDGRG